MSYAKGLLIALGQERDKYPEPLYSMLHCIIINQMNLEAECSRLQSLFDSMPTRESSSPLWRREEDCI